MIRVAILDDEPKSILSLEYELSLFENRIEIINTFSTVADALSGLNQMSIDCLFLDIEMPQMDGFRFLEKINPRNFEVVFVTAYSEYAIQAIREHAYDYLLKPVDGEDLDRVLTKLEDKKKQTQTTPHEKILLNTDQELRMIRTKEIIYCESEGSYTCVHLICGSKLMVSKNLKHLQSQLQQFPFFRIHHSFLINVDHFELLDKSQSQVLMKSGERLPLSRLRKKEFLEVLKNQLKS